MNQTAVPDEIYQLYDLQGELTRALGKRSWTKKFKEEMHGKIRKLDRLFRTVSEKCRGYLGGEDVFQSITEIREDVRKRIGGIPNPR